MKANFPAGSRLLGLLLTALLLTTSPIYAQKKTSTAPTPKRPTSTAKAPAAQQPRNALIPPDAKPLNPTDLKTALEKATAHWGEALTECTPGSFYIEEGGVNSSGFYFRVTIHELRNAQVQIFPDDEYASLGYIPPAHALNGIDWAGYCYLISDVERQSTDGVNWGPYTSGNSMSALAAEVRRRTGMPPVPDKVKIGPLFIRKVNNEWKLLFGNKSSYESIHPYPLAFRKFVPPGCGGSKPPVAYKLYSVPGFVDVERPSEWEAEIDRSQNIISIFPTGGKPSADGLTVGVFIGQSRSLSGSSQDLNAKANQRIKNLLKDRPDFAVVGSLKSEGLIDGRQAVSALLRGSNGTEKLSVWIVMINTDDGLVYLESVSSTEEANNYKPIFDRIARSIKFQKGSAPKVRPRPD